MRLFWSERLMCLGIMEEPIIMREVNLLYVIDTIELDIVALVNLNSFS